MKHIKSMPSHLFVRSVLVDQSLKKFTKPEILKNVLPKNKKEEKNVFPYVQHFMLT